MRPPINALKKYGDYVAFGVGVGLAILSCAGGITNQCLTSVSSLALKLLGASDG